MSDPFDDIWDELETEQDTSAQDTARVESLLTRLTRARHTFYNNGVMPAGMNPLTLSDAEYDALEDDLRDEIVKAEAATDTPSWLEGANAYLANVGAPTPPATPGKQHWKKAKHEAPMGSLNKAQRLDQHPDPHIQFRAWYASCESSIRQEGVSYPLTMVVSDKCDGISLSLKYEDGVLVRGVTRGDGAVGDDITRNIKKMKGVRLTIPGFTGYVRAEIVLRKSDWMTHFPDYQNARNAASGISKRLDGTGSEHLTVLHYQLIRVGGKPLTQKQTEFKVLNKLGCPVPQFALVDNVDDAIKIYEAYVGGRRSKLDYDIDGLVYEFNDLELMSSLGELHHRPRGAVAFKFPHEKQKTVLREIKWQVGRTGRVTPVAAFDTVRLVGANVSNASLHNLSNIRKLFESAYTRGVLPDETRRTHFCLGDTILVSRRNDVIPFCEEFVAAGPGTVPLSAPTGCPECYQGLQMDGEYLVCKNSAACPAQIAGLISTWVTKLGLKGWGSSIVAALAEQDFVSEPADLYRLDPAVLATVEMNGRKIGSKAHTIVAELNNKGRALPLHVFIGSLGIPLCARSVAKMIVDAGYDTLARMRNATRREIAAIPKLGDTKAEAFILGMLAKSDIIDNLLTVGVSIKPPADGPLKGLAVCMTGFRDADMTSTIEEQGGTVKSSVTRTLAYLVLKDPKSKSGKAKKALDYNEKNPSHTIQIVGIDEMWAVLRG